LGKPGLAKEIGKRYKNTVYLNYDRAEDREIIRKELWPGKTELLIMDELHKMKGWKNYIKGVFDTKEKNQRILLRAAPDWIRFARRGILYWAGSFCIIYCPCLWRKLKIWNLKRL